MSQGTFSSSFNSRCSNIFTELQSNQVGLKDGGFVSSTAWDTLCLAAFNGKVRLPNLVHLINGKTFDFPQSLSSMTAVAVINAFTAKWCWQSLKYSPSLQRHFHCQTICCAQLYHLMHDQCMKNILQWSTLNLVTGNTTIGNTKICNYQRVFHRCLHSCIRLAVYLRDRFDFSSMVTELEQKQSADDVNVDNSNLGRFIINTANIDDSTMKRWFLFVSSFTALTEDELKALEAGLVDKTNIYSLNDKVLKKMFSGDDEEEKVEISNTVFGNYKWSVAPVINLFAVFSDKLQEWFKDLKQIWAQDIKDQCTDGARRGDIDIIMNDDDDCKSCCDSIDSLRASNAFVVDESKCTLNMFKWLIFTDKEKDVDDEVQEPKLTVNELLKLFAEFEKFRSKFKWSNTWTRYGSQYKSIADSTNLFGYVYGWFFFLVELMHFEANLKLLVVRSNGTANMLLKHFRFAKTAVSDETVSDAWIKWRKMNDGLFNSMALTNLMVHFGEFERKLSPSQLVCTQLDKQSAQDSQAELFVAESVALQMNPDRENLKNQQKNYSQHQSTMENIRKTGATNLQTWNVKRKKSIDLLVSFESNPHYGYKLCDFLGLQLITSETSIGQWWSEQQELQQQFNDWHAIHSNKYQVVIQQSLGVEANVLNQHTAHKSVISSKRQHGHRPGNMNQVLKNEDGDGEDNDIDDAIDCASGGVVKKCGDWCKVKALKNNCVEIMENVLAFIEDTMKCNALIFNSNGKFVKVTKYIGQVKTVNDNDGCNWKAQLKDAFIKKHAVDMTNVLNKIIHQIKVHKNDGDTFIWVSCNFYTIVGELILLPIASGEEYIQFS